jgi:hypothetical protein
MTLCNVAVPALILGAMGGVVRYKVEADRFAAVDRTLAERARKVIDPRGNEVTRVVRLDGRYH